MCVQDKNVVKAYEPMDKVLHQEMWHESVQNDDL